MGLPFPAKARFTFVAGHAVGHEVQDFGENQLAPGGNLTDNHRANSPVL